MSAEAVAAKAEAEMKRHTENMDIIRAQSKAAAAPSQATTCDALPQLGGSQAGEVKLEETVDQTITGSFKVTTLDEVKAARKVYTTKMERKAPKDEIPTPGQLTALRHMVVVCFAM